jgi:hypothetical protein
MTTGTATGEALISVISAMEAGRHPSREVAYCGAQRPFASVPDERTTNIEGFVCVQAIHEQ